MGEPKHIEDLLHGINNLLAVIQTQAEVARVLKTELAQREALAAIEAAAVRTGRAVRQFREQLRHAGGA